MILCNHGERIYKTIISDIGCDRKEKIFMSISEMTEIELEKKLKDLWNRADNISSNIEEYEEIVNEVLSIRKYCIENHITLKPSIEARF